MKISKKQLAFSLLSILILIAGAGLLIAQYVIPFAFFTHPILNLLLVYSIGFGIMCFVLGFSKKSPWFFLLTSVLVAYVVFYICMQFIFWWIGLILAIILCVIVSILSFISAGNKTEDIALNTKPEYKNYQERKAEKEEIEAQKEPEELPQIKSFKD